ncbi:uncharacterized protein EDB91DRAFT_162827 [Suillus paluster]|uniref:uncharacterized protein n=1 Tax=Suillus paluster TaxID=48578 RepID=UPI001B863BC3|nr:uncharacterized protein EDB91DRAFT_162827 [Suillus paluster]KAG1723614.1 hypothetical protein EDB91DRAFT_162827 [Suillus paluster]
MERPSALCASSSVSSSPRRSRFHGRTSKYFRGELPCENWSRASFEVISRSRSPSALTRLPSQFGDREYDTRQMQKQPALVRGMKSAQGDKLLVQFRSPRVRRLGIIYSFRDIHGKLQQGGSCTKFEPDESYRKRDRKCQQGDGGTSELGRSKAPCHTEMTARMVGLCTA